MSEIALYNTLRKIPEVSEAEAKEAVASVANSKEVATKADIARLEAATKADIARLEAATKADIARLEAATKADIAKIDKTITELKAETKADIAELETRLTKLIYAVATINTGVIIAVVGLMIKFL